MSKNLVELSMRKAVFVSLAVGVSVGLIVAAFIMHIAWEHNPQQVYHESGDIHWGYWFDLGFLWFAMVGGGLSLLLSIISVVVIWLSRKSGTKKKKGTGCFLKKI